jgi:hypothetical protein
MIPLLRSLFGRSKCIPQGVKTIKKDIQKCQTFLS